MPEIRFFWPVMSIRLSRFAGLYVGEHKRWTMPNSLAGPSLTQSQSSVEIVSGRRKKAGHRTYMWTKHGRISYCKVIGSYHGEVGSRVLLK